MIIANQVMFQLINNRAYSSFRKLLEEIDSEIVPLNPANPNFIRQHKNKIKGYFHLILPDKRYRENPPIIRPLLQYQIPVVTFSYDLFHPRDLKIPNTKKFVTMRVKEREVTNKFLWFTTKIPFIGNEYFIENKKGIYKYLISNISPSYSGVFSFFMQNVPILVLPSPLFVKNKVSQRDVMNNPDHANFLKIVLCTFLRMKEKQTKFIKEIVGQKISRWIMFPSGSKSIPMKERDILVYYMLPDQLKVSSVEMKDDILEYLGFQEIERFGKSKLLQFKFKLKRFPTDRSLPEIEIIWNDGGLKTKIPKFRLDNIKFSDQFDFKKIIEYRTTGVSTRQPIRQEVKIDLPPIKVQKKTKLPLDNLIMTVMEESKLNEMSLTEIFNAVKIYNPKVKQNDVAMHLKKLVGSGEIVQTIDEMGDVKYLLKSNQARMFNLAYIITEFLEKNNLSEISFSQLFLELRTHYEEFEGMDLDMFEQLINFLNSQQLVLLMEEANQKIVYSMDIYDSTKIKKVLDLFEKYGGRLYLNEIVRELSWSPERVNLMLNYLTEKNMVWFGEDPETNAVVYYLLGDDV